MSSEGQESRQTDTPEPEERETVGRYSLSQAVVRQVEAAIQEVMERSGWGQVAIIIEKGRITKLQPAPSIWLGRQGTNE